MPQYEFHGTPLAHRIAEELIARSASFSMEPLPYDQWAVTFKPEQEDRVRKLIADNPLSLDVARTVAADEAWDLYDFGADVVDSNGWYRDGDTYSRVAFLENALKGLPSVKSEFFVVFIPKSAEIKDMYTEADTSS